VKKILIGISLILNLTYAWTLPEAIDACMNKNDKDMCARAGTISLQKGDPLSEIYLKKGCDLDSGGACVMYGGLLSEKGQLDEAYKYFEKSCSLKNESGCLLFKGIQKTKNDIKLCNNGNANSCVNVATDYILGTHTKANDTNAIVYYALACGRGHQDSCEDMALIDKRELHSIKVLEKQCDSGDKDICYKVGLFYINLATENKDKTSVMLDIMSASIYLKESCKLGKKEACVIYENYELEKAYNRLSGKEKS